MPFLSLLVGASLFCGSCGASKPAAEEEKYAKPDWTYDFLPNGFGAPQSINCLNFSRLPACNLAAGFQTPQP